MGSKVDKKVKSSKKSSKKGESSKKERSSKKDIPKEKDDKKKSKKEIERAIARKMAETEDEKPKHVNIRLTYSQYLEIQVIADVFGKIGETSCKSLQKILNEHSEYDKEINAEVAAKRIAKLPKCENTMVNFYLHRRKHGEIFFTKKSESTKEVYELYKRAKVHLNQKTRHDQKEYTCPSDVRSLLYAYVRGHNLKDEKTKMVAVDKFLKEIAPKSFEGVDSFMARDGSFIWIVCSEIRGDLKIDDKFKEAKKRLTKAKKKHTDDDKSLEKEEDEYHEEEEEEDHDHVPVHTSHNLVDGQDYSDVSSDDENEAKEEEEEEQRGRV